MATITLTFDAANATRIQDALTEMLDLRDEGGEPRQATPDDYKAYLIAKTKQIVKTAERRVAERAIEPTDVDVT